MYLPKCKFLQKKIQKWKWSSGIGNSGGAGSLRPQGSRPLGGLWRFSGVAPCRSNFGMKPGSRRTGNRPLVVVVSWSSSRNENDTTQRTTPARNTKMSPPAVVLVELSPIFLLSVEYKWPINANKKKEQWSAVEATEEVGIRQVAGFLLSSEWCMMCLCKPKATALQRCPMLPALSTGL